MDQNRAIDLIEIARSQTHLCDAIKSLDNAWMHTNDSTLESRIREIKLMAEDIEKEVGQKLSDAVDEFPRRGEK